MTKPEANEMQRDKMLVGGYEARTYPTGFQVRTMPNSRAELTGYASTVNRPYTMYDMMGEYVETVRGGAFAKTLSEGADVGFLANHGGLTLARTKTQTLHLSEDSTGLLTVATLNTARTDARDLLTAVEDGDVTEMSFGFRIVRQEWNDSYSERALVELNLDRGDVSAVNFGANPNTSISPHRAFNSIGQSRAHAIGIKLRSGEPLSSAQLLVLTRALDMVAEDAPLAEKMEVAKEAVATGEVPQYLLMMQSQAHEL